MDKSQQPKGWNDKVTGPKTVSEKAHGRQGTIYGIASFSIRYPVTICVIFLLVTLFGTISIFRIPVVLMPSMDYPFLNVYVPYENSSPAQTQESITKPLEEVLATVPGVKRMSARSAPDFARVNLSFDWGHDINVTRNEVREKIEQIRNTLPDDIDQIFIRSWGTDDRPILGGMISSTRNLSNSGDLLESKIKKPLERIPGVAEVDIWGAEYKEIDIYLRLNDLKKHRVDLEELFARLDNLNRNRSLGEVHDSGIKYGTMMRGALSSLREVENFPINENGLRLGDIAEVVYQYPSSGRGNHLNGKPALAFGVKKNSDANTVEVVRRVRAKLSEIQRDPELEGFDLMVWRDAGKEITNSLSGLLSAGTIGALLATVVLLAFVKRLSITLIIGMGIPCSIIAAIGFLYLGDKTLNSMTMLGLMLASGMLVDNAVVVLESIYQKLEKGLDRVNAAEVGTKEVGTAVIAATLTSIIIFVPLIFGQETDFSIRLAHTGTALIFALICSLFISLTLIPLAMARLVNIEAGRQSKWQKMLVHHLTPPTLWLGRRSFRREYKESRPTAPSRKNSRLNRGVLTDWYLHLVAWPLRHRLLVGLLIVPPLVAGSVWLLLNKVPDNTPEAQDMEWIGINYEFSENYHYAKIEEDYVKPVEKFLLGNRERLKITDVESYFRNDFAGTWVYFDRATMTLEELEMLRNEIAEGLPVIPGAEISLGGGSGRNRNWLNVNLFGDDPNVLQALAREARSRLLSRPDFSSVWTNTRGAQEEVQISLNRELARKYGISPDSVSRALDIMVRGRRVRSYRRPEGEVEMWVRLRPEDRTSLDDLASLVVGRNPEGREILLSGVADFPVEKIPGVLEREDRRTYVGLSAVYSGERRAEGKKAMESVLSLLDYPEGYGWSYGFWTRRGDQGDQDFLFNILIALFMVYFVMASLFESFSHPLAIMVSLPFAVVGMVIILLATGSPFNWMAKVGSLVLIGIVVNNGIVMIDHINNLRRAGLPRAEAIIVGCGERLRPILMTAATTVISLLPLAFGSSGMLGMRYFPMARTLMGGLLASTILTLIILPTYYSLFDDLAVWMRRLWRETSPLQDISTVHSSRGRALKQE